MIFIVHPDRTVTTIAETLHVGDTSADVTVLSPFSGVQNCMLKFLLPTGEEGTPQFLNYYGDGTDLGLGYEGSVYTMKIPAVMTKVAGTVQVQIIFTDTGAQQFVSETATFTVSGIEVLPFPDSEEQGEDFAAQLLAMQAALAATMEAAKVGDTVCKFVTASANTTITLKNLTGMYQIDWGDGTVDNELSHTYAEAGTYTCYITGVTAIGSEAFKAIGALKSIVIGDAVQSIGAQAFQNCTDLDYVTIGSGVTSIGNAAFSGSSVSAITIPDTVTEINANAFFNCAYLQTAVIGNGVRSIGNYAFYGCSSLKQIIFKGTTPPTITSTTPFASANNCPLFVPYKCLAAYQSATYYSSIASRIFVTDTQPMTGTSDPTTSTATDYVGKVYINTTTNAAFVCTNINAGVYTWQPIGASTITVDSALSSSSENPVQNKVITDALNDKQDTLTFDDAPTAGSNNPVKSGGIKTALDGKVDENSPITGATKAKITYDEKGLVTGGADLSASDIPALTLAKITDAGAAASKGVATAISGSSTDADLATAKAVHDAIDALPDPMRFMGSLGVGGTYAFLPAASSANGYTYKVITAGTYEGIAAQVGDTFISNGTEWVLIPSGDEPSGTVTSVGVSVPTGFTVSGSPVTSSGTIAIGLASGYSIPTDAKQSEWDSKQPALTFDNAPTANSDNPVKSGGVKTALDGKVDKKSFSNNPATWVDPTSFIEGEPETANKHRILAGIYCVDEDGNQVILPFSMAGGARVDGEPEGSETDPNGTPLGIPTFVMYNRANQVLVCKATNVKHAVPLGQLQDFLAGKLDKVAATSANARKLYGTNNAGGSYMWKVLRTVAEMQTADGGVMGRADNNHFVAPTPTANDDIANKKYVDDGIAAKQDILTAGTGIDITGNVISATGGGGEPWNVASDFTNGEVTLSLTADKIYEIVVLGYHPMGDFTPMSTGVFMLDTNSNYTADGSNVKNVFGTNVWGLECAVTMNSNTSVTLTWVDSVDGTWSGWFIKVLYREATIAT